MEQLIASLALNLGQQVMNAAITHTQGWSLDDWQKFANSILLSDHNSKAGLARCVWEAVEAGAIDHSTAITICQSLYSDQGTPKHHTIDLPVINMRR